MQATLVREVRSQISEGFLKLAHANYLARNEVSPSTIVVLRAAAAGPTTWQSNPCSEIYPCLKQISMLCNASNSLREPGSAYGFGRNSATSITKKDLQKRPDLRYNLQYLLLANGPTEAGLLITYPGRLKQGTAPYRLPAWIAASLSYPID